MKAILEYAANAHMQTETIYVFIVINVIGFAVSVYVDVPVWTALAWFAPSTIAFGIAIIARSLVRASTKD